MTRNEQQYNLISDEKSITFVKYFSDEFYRNSFNLNPTG